MKKIILFCICLAALHFSLASAQSTSVYGLVPNKLYCTDDPEQKIPLVVMFSKKLNRVLWDRPNVVNCAQVNENFKPSIAGIFDVEPIHKTKDPGDQSFHTYMITLTLLHKNPKVMGDGFINRDGSFSITNEITPDNKQADLPHTTLLFRLLPYTQN